VEGKGRTASDGTDSESNSFDKRDDMSEDELVVLGGKIDDSVDNVNIDESEDNRSKQGVKRRRKRVKMKATTETERSKKAKSKVWDAFTKVTVPDTTEKGKMISKAKCNYCKKLYSYIQGSTTSHLSRHMRICAVYLKHVAKQQDQSLLNFAPSTAGESGSGLPTITSPKDYNHEQVKKLIAKMIIVHEYPFRMVEHTWFNIVMRYLNPSYEFIGRKTIRAECLKIYESEKESLAKVLKGVEYISLTTDLWTSNQTLSYMCLVAHYIDNDWKMQCRVLNFFELDPPHKGPVIGQAVYECVAGWKIEDKIVSMTLDNASNNDGAIRGLRARFSARQGSAFVAKYFHIRCCAHIINLVVKDGTAALDSLISNLRSTVKYVMVIATILDPRYKMRFIEWCFNKIFDEHQVVFELEDVRSELEKLYGDFEVQHRERKESQSKSNASSSLSVERSCSLPSASCQFQSFLSSTQSNPSKSELLIYLEETNVCLSDKEFDLLNWWKVNSHRFPVVSRMAKKFLTILATSVSSESTFSTGGRTLDDYRSSLRPSMVEALVCSSSWIRGTHDGSMIYVEEDDEDNVENIMFPKSLVESN